MRTLLLIKHSLPEVVPGVPAREWRLAEEGRRRCAALAGRVAPYAPAALVSSAEPKAEETARLLGGRLGLAVEVAADLREHDRSGVGYLGEAAFAAAMARFFAEPERLAFGGETAAQAEARFAAAVAGALARHDAGTVAIVAHGTVIALYVAARTGLSAHALWRHLGLPALVALELPGYALLETVREMG